MNRKTRRARDAEARRKRNEADPKRKRANVPPMTLEEKLYRAYGASAKWRNFKGDPMPSWESLPPHIKRHWQAVAVETQNFAREAMVETIKDMVERNVGDATDDAQADLEAGKAPRVTREGERFKVAEQARPGLGEAHDETPPPDSGEVVETVEIKS